MLYSPITLFNSYILLNPCSTFTDNYGSAIVARSSLLYISGNLLFARNIGTTGAALKLYDISRVSSSGPLRPYTMWAKASVG